MSGGSLETARAKPKELHAPLATYFAPRAPGAMHFNARLQPLAGETVHHLVVPTWYPSV